MRTRSLPITAEADLAPLARTLAAALPARAFLALAGDLGAGKTTFVKACAAAVGIDPAEVVSPTFGLVHEHPAPGGILLHADMYRLAGPDDLHELGWDDAVARARWVFVEWPERIAVALPADRLDVTITIDTPTARTLTFTGHGPAHEAVIDHLHGLHVSEQTVAQVRPSRMRWPSTQETLGASCDRSSEKRQG